MNIGKCNIPLIEENNSANYVVSSKIVYTEINYYPTGAFHFENMTNHLDNVSTTPSNDLELNKKL